MNATVICGERAHACVCALPPNHDGPHACGNDDGVWSGKHGTPTFRVICWPFRRIEQPFELEAQ